MLLEDFPVSTDIFFQRCIFLNFVLEERSFFFFFWKVAYSERVKNKK